MGTIRTIWDFFQNEVLGMGWLSRLISNLLNACGLDTSGKIGGSIQFFLYDVIKIMVLLGVLILLISYIQSYFLHSKLLSARAKQKDFRTFSWNRSKYNFSFTRYSDTFLLLFFNTTIYWFYKCRLTAWRNIFISYFITNG